MPLGHPVASFAAILETDSGKLPVWNSPCVGGDFQVLQWIPQLLGWVGSS